MANQVTRLETHLRRWENVVYPPDSQAIVDVTRPPYNADPTGQTDCSEALIRAYDDVMRTIQEHYEETVRALQAGDDVRLGFESTSARGAIFPHRTPPSRLLYFPNGTYLVSRSICYTLETLQNARGAEMNRQIHFLGQNRDQTTIKLVDNAPGFGPGADRPVLSLMHPRPEARPQRGESPRARLHSVPGAHSNVAMSNTVENLTIDIGAGNPGAIGLLYHCSNTGAIRNVRIRSGDPQGAGAIGLAITMGKPMGCLTQHVNIEGFDVGIQIDDFMLYSVMEHVALRGQRRVGVRIYDHPLSMREVRSENAVPAVEVTGPRGHLVLVDSVLAGAGTSLPAVDVQRGALFARNVSVSGYASSIRLAGKPVAHGNIDEYSSHGVQTLYEGQRPRSLGLPVRETPDLPWPQDAEQWASVTDWGAAGDGEHDDTVAIRAAMQSGRAVVYFEPGQYLLDGSIDVPPSVERIHFCFCDLKAGPALRGMAGVGAFRVVGESETPLAIEDLFCWEDWHGEHYMIEHASTRTLILSDLHVQTGTLYFNSAPGGQLYIENVCCTPGKHAKPQPCLILNGQQVWARQLNPERADPEVINDGSTLWVLGFKTEMCGVSYLTRGGGQTEVLGGVVNNFSPGVSDEQPILITEGGDISFTAVTNGRSTEGRYFKVIARERRGDEVRVLGWADVPRRYEKQSLIPLYVGYRAQT